MYSTAVVQTVNEHRTQSEGGATSSLASAPEPSTMSRSGAEALGAPFLQAQSEHPSDDPIEDTHVVLAGEDFVYVGVYDGHGGARL